MACYANYVRIKPESSTSVFSSQIRKAAGRILLSTDNDHKYNDNEDNNNEDNNNEDNNNEDNNNKYNDNVDNTTSVYNTDWECCRSNTFVHTLNVSDCGGGCKPGLIQSGSFDPGSSSTNGHLV